MFVISYRTNEKNIMKKFKFFIFVSTLSIFYIIKKTVKLLYSIYVLNLFVSALSLIDFLQIKYLKLKILNRKTSKKLNSRINTI